VAKGTGYPDPSFHSQGTPGVYSQQAPGNKRSVIDGRYWVYDGIGGL